MIKNFGVSIATAASLLLALDPGHSRAWGQNNTAYTQCPMPNAIPPTSRGSGGNCPIPNFYPEPFDFAQESPVEGSQFPIPPSIAQVSQGLPGPTFLRDNSDRFEPIPVYLPPDELAPYNFSPPPSIEGTSSKLYLVYIPGDNSRIMQRVRLVEPEAFYSNYRGRRVIQAGVFGIRSNAQRRARQLERDGVRAAIATLEQTRPIDSFEEGLDVGPIFLDEDISSRPLPLPPSLNGSFDASSGYVVVIPGSRPDLPIIADIAVKAGTSQQIAYREEPIGTHVAIGPFPDRTDAQRESNLLRRVGLDARVYYQR